MLQIIPTKKFEKDYKLAIRRGKNINKLKQIVDFLAHKNFKILISRFKDHSLKGNYFDCRECHIESDWLLIYKIGKNHLILTRTGSHADLFE